VPAVLATGLSVGDEVSEPPPMLASAIPAPTAATSAPSARSLINVLMVSLLRLPRFEAMETREKPASDAGEASVKSSLADGRSTGEDGRRWLT
jgi:hypothetical protein